MTHRRFALALALALALDDPDTSQAQRAGVPATLEPPRAYVVYRAATPPRIDGRLDDGSWMAAPWTEDFVDVEGSSSPRPRLRTRARMLWDDRYLYIAAELEEPDVWGSVTRRDDVVFRDDDFEVFIDPDGDTHDYYELEVNALGTVWDLLLTRPYRDGGRPLDGWDIHGLRLATRVQGTLNRAGDRDRGWTVEMALPWEALREAAPERRAPRPGERWRLDFSRVEWDVDVRAGHYLKRTDAAGRPLPEHNWVWSPQGAVNMHMPERWGFLQFSARVAGSGSEAFVPDPDQPVLDALRALYYAERRYHERHGAYAADLAALEDLPPGAAGAQFRPRLQATTDLFQADAPTAGGAVLHIRQDGKSWTTPR